MILALLLLAQTAPAPEAEALGRKLAESGTLATLMPLMLGRETEELVAEHPDWSDADKAALRATADAVANADRNRLLDALGHAYATRLSIDDLRALVAFEASEAARHQHAALPEVIGESMASVGQIDFKGDTRKAFCAKTGKGCEAK